MRKRGKREKGLAILLAAAMVAGMFPGAGTWKVSAASDVSVTSVTDETQLEAAVKSNGKVQLSADIQLTKALYIPANVTVTLDLNGNKLTGVQTSEVINILKESNVTVTDSSEQVSGSITGGSKGVVVNGTFTLEKGSIAGNQASVSSKYEAGGGVLIGSSGKMYMTGGEITKNAACKGGGIYINSNGYLKMTGGEISENEAIASSPDDCSGAAVYLMQTARFEMFGGKIVNNKTAHQVGSVEKDAKGAVYKKGGTPVIVGGTAVIKDNYYGTMPAGDDGEWTNLKGWDVGGGDKNEPILKLTNDCPLTSGAEIYFYNNWSGYAYVQFPEEYPLESLTGGYFMDSEGVPKSSSSLQAAKQFLFKNGDRLYKATYASDAWRLPVEYYDGDKLVVTHKGKNGLNVKDISSYKLAACDADGFGGWYYDKELTKPVGDSISFKTIPEGAELILYAKTNYSTGETSGALQPEQDPNGWDGRASNAFAGGTGTEEDPYQIQTPAQLAGLLNYVNDQNKNYNAAYYILKNDIDLNNQNWKLIANKCFYGSIDGDGHTIKNFYYRGSAIQRVGLFSEGGSKTSIKNLNMENVTIVNTYEDGLTGALLGSSYGCTIQNCQIKSGTITGTGRVGGFIGLTGVSGGKTDYPVRFDNCANYASLRSVMATVNSGIYGCGGMIGYSQGANDITTYQISNCKNYGTIEANKYNAAGIVGNIGITKSGNYIKNCANYGDLTSGAYAGGIVAAGICDVIQNCYNLGKITVENKTSGGITGTVTASIKNCYSLNSGAKGEIAGNVITKKTNITNCVYLDTGKIAANTIDEYGKDYSDQIKENTALTKEQFGSGMAAFLLNEGDDERNWHQTLGSDDTPVLDPTHETVYADGNCIAKAEYSNKDLGKNIAHDHSLIHHDEVPADCQKGMKAYYECSDCGNLYEDSEGQKRISKSDLLTAGTGVHKYGKDGMCTSDGCHAGEPAVKNEAGVYEIKKLGNLVYFADEVVNKTEIENPGSQSMLIKEPTSPTDSAVLMADIDLSPVYHENGKSWLPLGGNGHYYRGEFNGNGHMISGLYINSNSVEYAGFFGRLATGVAYVHDLTLKDVSINAPKASYTGGIAAGMIPYTKAPRIENCLVAGGTISGNTYVGGITGRPEQGSIPKLDENGEETGDEIPTGYISEIINCGVTAVIKGPERVGGIMGRGSARIKNCYFNGNVPTTGTSSYFTSGSIAGSFKENGIITNCYYLGDSENAYGPDSKAKVTMTKTEFKPADAFKSGEVAFMLSSNAEEAVWGQKLGETADAYPVLKKTEDKNSTVYQNTKYSGCSEKNPGDVTYVYANEEVDPVYGDHTDDDKDGICDVCGEYMDGIGARLAGYSLSLSGNIGVNFYMELSDEVLNAEGAYMNFSLPNGTSQKVYVTGSHEDGATAVTDTTVADGTTYYVFACEVAAKEMTSDIKAQIIAGDKTGTEYTYTVRDYADYILKHAANDTNTDGYDTETVALVKAMLYYGGSAQKYFGYHTEKPASDGIDFYFSDFSGDITEEWMNDEKYKTVISGASDVCTFQAAYLSLKSTTDICVYVKLAEGVDAAKTKFYIGDNEVIPQEAAYNGKDCYKLTVTGVKAKDLASMYTFKVRTEDGAISKTATLSYGAFSYAHTVFNSAYDSTAGMDKLRAVMNGMYLYYNRATVYAVKHPGTNN